MDIDREELKDMMRDILQELIWEMEQGLPDPDAGLTLRPEIVDTLLAAQQTTPPTRSYDDVMRE